MGRKLMRVPLDFDWPLNANWRGYINPWCGVSCTVCKGTGSSPEYNALDESFYDLDRKGTRWCDRLTQEEVDLLWREGRLTWLGGRSRLVECPTAAEVNADRNAHDGINRWLLCKHRAAKAGVPLDCRFCDGGTWWPSAYVKRRSEAFKSTDPPTGDGYQLWQTTSEGSPVSPVFATIEDLCAWCATGATTFGSARATADEWRAMLDADFVVHREGSMVFM